MKTLYLDIFSGISGDMFVAALIDLGVDAGCLERELQKLDLHGYSLDVSRRKKCEIEGVKFDVRLTGDREREADHRHYSDIERLLTSSRLSTWVKQKSLAVFQRIAQAEGQIHGIAPDKVHFHEVGAVDSIVDITGAAVALEMLDYPRVLASPVVDGCGWVQCAHGRLPVPTPATLAILGARGVGITQCDESHELVTPTGAALLAEFVENFGLMTNLVAEKVGYGLGTRDNKTRPNVLRAVLGTSDRSNDAGHATNVTSQNASSLDWETDRIAVLETNLDDCSGEVLGHFVETAMAAGALDVFHTPIQMKKSRPGVLLTVLCADIDADRFSELLLRETTTFGVRRTFAERRMLRRDLVQVITPYGLVTAKIGSLAGKDIRVAPEYESAKRVAAKANVPLSHVYQETVKCAKQRK